MDLKDQVLKNRQAINSLINNSQKLIDLVESTEDLTKDDFIVLLKNTGTSYKTKKIKANSVGGAGSGGGVYINNNNVPETLGNYVSGKPATPISGLTLQDAFDKLLFPPQLPSISFNVNNALIEKGSNYSKTIQINFNQQDAGNATAYSLEKNGSEVSNSQSTSFSANQVLSDFTLKGKVTYEASSNVNAGTISTSTKNIRVAIPQWKGQKSTNTSLNELSYNNFQTKLGNRFISNNHATSITVNQGNYGFFISKKNNATIKDGNGFVMTEGGNYIKRNITAKLINGNNVTLTEYVINTANGDFTYNLE